MGLLTCLFAGALLLCAAVAGVAQTEAPVKTQAETEAVPAPPPPSPTAWGLGPVNVSGLVDGYYSLGFNHPAGKSVVFLFPGALPRAVLFQPFRLFFSAKHPLYFSRDCRAPLRDP